MPSVLNVEDLSGGRWTAPHPDAGPDKRDVVFSGQMLAQMIHGRIAAWAVRDRLRNRGVVDADHLAGDEARLQQIHGSVTPDMR